jgi:polysaccharide biosynthesis/export protein
MPSFSLRHIQIILMLLMLSSCSVINKHFVQKTDLPYLQGEGEYKAPAAEPYKIEPNDVLSISLNSSNPAMNQFFNRQTGQSVGASQLNNAAIYFTGYMVNDSGYVDIPKLGKVFAKGKTVTEIEHLISQEMAKHVLEYSVSVKLANFRVTILGEVARPGVYYFYEENVNILQAIAMGGEFSSYANRKKVRLIREYPEKTVAQVVDLSGTDVLSSNAYKLRSKDVIYIEPLRSKTFMENTRTISVVLSVITAALTLFRILQTQ